MNFTFNPIANWIRSWKCPWLSVIMNQLWLLFLEKLEDISKEIIALLIEKIKELQKEDISGPAKFDKLIKYAEQIGVDMSNKDWVNAFFNSLVLTVKTKF